MMWFIFIGDMLVMLFMVVVAAWVFYRGTDDVIDRSARIPLEDEQADSGGRGDSGEARGARPRVASGEPSRGDGPDA